MFKQRVCSHLIMCILFYSGNEKAKGNPSRVQTSLFETGENQPLESPFSRWAHIHRSICAHGRESKICLTIQAQEMAVKWNPSSPGSPWYDYRAGVCGSLLTVNSLTGLWRAGVWWPLITLCGRAYRFYVRVGLKRMVISWCSHFCFINNTLENKVDLTHLLWLKTPC